MAEIKVQLNRKLTERKRILVDPQTGTSFRPGKVVVTPETSFVSAQIIAGGLVRAGAEEPVLPVKVRFLQDHKIGKNEYAVGDEKEVKADYAAKLIADGKAEVIPQELQVE